MEGEDESRAPSTLLLQNPAILLMGLPSRSRETLGFTRNNVWMTGERLSDVDFLYSDINDPNEVSLLKRLLEKVIACEDWRRYFQTSSMSFRWSMGKRCVSSANPFFELYMRSLRALMRMVNGASQGKKVPTGEEIEAVLEATNLSLMGMNFCPPDVPADGPVQFPALLSPPFLRESPARTFDGIDTLVLPTVSVFLVRCLTHTLVAEIWMKGMHDSIGRQLQAAPGGEFSGFREVKDYHRCIGQLTREVLLDDRNPLREHDLYVRYIESRLNPDNGDSDANRLFALANVLAMDKRGITPGFKQYLRRLYPGYGPEASRTIRSKIGGSWPTGLKESGRLRPRCFTPFRQLSDTTREGEGWAHAMERVASANTRRIRGTNSVGAFDVEPLMTELECCSLRGPESVSVSDSSTLFGEEETCRIRQMKCFSCCFS